MKPISSEYLAFSEPSLTNVKFEINSGFNGTSAVSIPVEMKSHAKELSAKTALISLTVKVGEESEKVPFFAFVTYQAYFKWKKGSFSENERQLKISGITLLISYVRPILSFLTASALMIPFQLPYIDVQHTLDEDEEIEVE